MATSSKTASALTDTAAGADVPALLPPVLGQIVTVRVAPGMHVINSEAGAPFEDGVDTPQTVTPTTLRRLADGDLIRVA